MKILVFLFIVLLVLWLLRPFLRVAFSMRRMQRQYDEMWEKVQQEAQQKAGRGQKRRRKKVFDSTDGEYVDFEEVREERTVVVDKSRGEKEIDDRITDVKYEEIKD